MKKYILISICAISLLSASCDLFNAPTAGVYKTSNGGIDWQATNILKPSTLNTNNNTNAKSNTNTAGSLAALGISRLAYSPQTADVVYASAFNAGLYKSTDGAATWEQILGQIPVIDFVINPNDDQMIYAVGSFEEKGRALITHDGGKSWNAIYTAATINSSVRAVALNPNSPEQVAIGLSQGELIMSNDAGSTWRLVQSYNDRINQIIWNNEGIYVVVKGTGVSRSVDGGNSFQLITANLQSAGNTSTLSIFGNSISSFNQLAISQSNSRTMYLTTNLGLYRSYSGGSNWDFVSMPLRQSAVSPTAVAIARSSDNVVYVSAGSVVYKTADSGSTWSTADTQTNNLVNALIVDPNLPQAAYAGIYTN